MGVATGSLIAVPMKTVPLEGETLRRTLASLATAPMFRGLTPDQLSQVASHATYCLFEDGETLMEQGAPSDSFFVLLTGAVSVRVATGDGEPQEVAALPPVTTIGEIGLLLEHPRGASAVATRPSDAVRFDAKIFSAMIQRIPAFGLGLCRVLAERVGSSNLPARLPLTDDQEPDEIAMEMLPVEILQRFQMLPMEVTGNVLTMGFVDDPSPTALAAIRLNAPGMELQTVRIQRSLLERVLGVHASVEGWSGAAGARASMVPGVTPAPATAPGATTLGRIGTTKMLVEAAARTSMVPASAAAPVESRSPRLDALLKRMVAEGASDLHLSGGQRPRWRIDGEIHELSDTMPLSAEEVRELLEPLMLDRNREEYARDNDTDFAYALPGTARFRTNVFRDHHGAGAVLRQIPDKILSFEQLGLPPAAKAMCEHPKGLVLVTGPTGSGKSTTLAAMIDFINKNKKAHIITLEDPIEFVHESRMSLVNQREVGAHTTSFARALKAALREDPDIVLVGEMRDLETVNLALETANTGHLVFGTLHTSTAMSTVDRIVNLFRAEQQTQVRATLADVLRGVIAQTLCRKIGGGRIAALEVLVSSLAIANLIREGKTNQIPTSMSTARAAGNQVLNEELARLVLTKKVEANEALLKAVDKPDLYRRIGGA